MANTDGTSPSFWTNLVDFGSAGRFMWLTSRMPPSYGLMDSWLPDEDLPIGDGDGFSAVLLDNDHGSGLRCDERLEEAETSIIYRVILKFLRGFGSPYFGDYSTCIQKICCIRKRMLTSVFSADFI